MEMDSRTDSVIIGQLVGASLNTIKNYMSCIYSLDLVLDNSRKCSFKRLVWQHQFLFTSRDININGLLRLLIQLQMTFFVGKTIAKETFFLPIYRGIPAQE